MCSCCWMHRDEHVIEYKSKQATTELTDTNRKTDRERECARALWLPFLFIDNTYAMHVVNGMPGHIYSLMVIPTKSWKSTWDASPTATSNLACHAQFHATISCCCGCRRQIRILTPPNGSNGCAWARTSIPSTLTKRTNIKRWKWWKCIHALHTFKTF